MAFAVVDVLEMVEVEDRGHERSPARGPLRQQFHESMAVGQFGQRVDVGEHPQALLGLLLRGHVEADRGIARAVAVRHDRPVHPIEPARLGAIADDVVPDPSAADGAVEILEEGAIVHPRMDDAMGRADQFGFRIAAQFAELGIDRPDAAAAIGDRDDRGGVDRLALKIGERGERLKPPLLRPRPAFERGDLTVQVDDRLLSAMVRVDDTLMQRHDDCRLGEERKAPLLVKRK